MKLKVGLIGVGSIIASHVEAIQALPEFALVSICDTNPQRLKEQADKLCCPGYSSYHELLGTGLDVAVVCLPHHLHCQVTLDALEAGCHVLVEKPMANSVDQSNQMLAAADKHAKAILVAETASFDPGAILTGQKFKAGKLGRFLSGSISSCRQYFHVGRPSWFLDPVASGGGMFSNVGLHRLAIARACLPGLTPKMISASVSYIPKYKVEACTAALVKYQEGGAVLYEEMGYFPKPPWLNSGMHFVFEEGIVMWDKHTWKIMTQDGQEHQEILEPDPVPNRSVYANLLSAIKGQEYGPKAYELAVDVAIAQGMYASSQKGKEIDLTASKWKITRVNSV